MPGLMRSSMATRQLFRTALALAAGIAIAVVFAAQARGLSDAHARNAQLAVDNQRAAEEIADLRRVLRNVADERARLRTELDAARGDLSDLAVRLHTALAIAATTATQDELLHALKLEKARVKALEAAIGGSKFLPTFAFER